MIMSLSKIDILLTATGISVCINVLQHLTNSNLENRINSILQYHQERDNRYKLFIKHNKLLEKFESFDSEINRYNELKKDSKIYFKKGIEDKYYVMSYGKEIECDLPVVYER